MSDRFMFRQEIKKEYQKAYGSCWHYWGYVDMGFVSPLGPSQGGKSYKCTGLKDKSRTLIYDGDAEITSEPIDDAYGESAGWLKFYRVVRWFDEIASFVIFESSEDPNMETEIITFDHFKIVDGCITDFEVTTNIYENPELLEKVE